MHARGRHVGVEGRVFDQGDVGDGRAAAERAFEQVVTEHLAVGQAVRQHGVHRGDVEQALAGESAFAEDVLIDLGARRAVGVDAALAGEQPVIEREVFRCRQRRADARLQDAVALRDDAPHRVDDRLVVRVRRDADELAQAPGRQLRVAVERDDVARAGFDPRPLAELDERPRRAAAGLGCGQQSDQVFELAALALPADEALLGFAEHARPVQHDEARRAVGRRRVAGVQRSDVAHCCVEQRRVGGERGGRRVGPVGEQRELRVALRVREVVEFEPVGQRVGIGEVHQHAGDHDHHAVLGRDAVREREARQAARPGRFADQPVDHRDHRLGGRKQHQQRSREGQPERYAGVGQRLAVLQQHPGDERHGAAGQRAEVSRQCGMALDAVPEPRAGFVQPETPYQRRSACAVQPMARDGARPVAVAVTGFVPHQVHQDLCDLGFGAPAAAGQQLDLVQRRVARVGTLGLERGQAQQQLHGRAGVVDDLGPVGVADQAQRADRVADAQVVGGLLGRLLHLRGGQVGQGLQQPLVVRGQACRLMISQALRDLHQEHTADAAPIQQREQFVEARGGIGLDAVADQVRDLARCLVGGEAFGQTAQILDQHHPQRGRQGPELAEREFTGLLIRAEKVREQVLVECAVSVRDEGPGHAVDARQTSERLVDEHRQITKVAPRQALVDLLQLTFDEVKVVEEPLGRCAHLVASAGLFADVMLRLAQRADVVLQARKKCRRSA